MSVPIGLSGRAERRRDRPADRPRPPFRRTEAAAGTHRRPVRPARRWTPRPHRTAPAPRRAEHLDRHQGHHARPGVDRALERRRVLRDRRDPPTPPAAHARRPDDRRGARRGGSGHAGRHPQPLADPGLLGVNAGASAAVVFGIGVVGLAYFGSLVWFSFVGAALTTVIVYVLGASGRAGPTPVRLALAGAAVSASLSGVIAGLTVFDSATYDYLRFWMVGSLARPGTRTRRAVAAVRGRRPGDRPPAGPSAELPGPRRGAGPRARGADRPDPDRRGDRRDPALRGLDGGRRADRLRGPGRSARRPLADRARPALGAAVLDAAGPGAPAGLGHHRPSGPARRRVGGRRRDSGDRRAGVHRDGLRRKEASL